MTPYTPAFGLYGLQGDLEPDEQAIFGELMNVWLDKLAGNQRNQAYYDQQITPFYPQGTPSELKRIKFTLGWATKAVDMLTSRSRFMGYTSYDGEIPELTQVARDNNLPELYRQAVSSELISSCSFITVTGGKDNGVAIHAYSATQAAAIWDTANDCVKAGIAITDTALENGVVKPTQAIMYLPGKTVVCDRVKDGEWVAETHANIEGYTRPLMEVLRYHPDLNRPFGRSRISRTVRSLTDQALETMLRSEISAHFYTWPQRYLLGVDKKTARAMLDKKMETYIDSLMMVTTNQNGDIPHYGQLAQMSMTPHNEQLQTLAKLFAGETSVPLNSLGVVFDNPSSAEAINASQADLIAEAETINSANAEVLRHVALVALAHVRGGWDKLTDNDLTVTASFEKAMYQSDAQKADSTIKLAQGAPAYAKTSYYWRGVGKNETEIKGIMSEMERAERRELLTNAAFAPVEPSRQEVTVEMVAGED